MPDVKIKGYSAEFTYKDVPMLWLADPSQAIGELEEGETPNLVPFTYGQAVPKTVTPDFSGGDMAVPIAPGELVNQLTITKPADLKPENIPEGLYIAGVGPGTFAGGGGSEGGESTLLDYTNNMATTIGDHAFYQMPNLRSVVFSKATAIGKGAFRSCEDLVSVSFPEVTEIAEATGNILTKSRNYAFGYCEKLIDVYLPKVVTVGSGTFTNCSAVKHLELPLAQTIASLPPNLETAEFPVATSVSGFQYNETITRIKLPALKTIRPSLCLGCKSLQYLDTGATAIQYDGSAGYPPFYGCESLVAVILRSETMVTISHQNFNFDGTPIASGNGYFYVPSTLIENYKADTYWSKYASQFRAKEDYPDICG